ncbi:MAG TPA: hypothetical protein VMV83_17075 [Rectinemataceae bacterium]|nr:hypothetical protein [Rectinemataceae bacterium]
MRAFSVRAFFAIAILVSLCSQAVWAQNLVDVVYLKNGSIVRGTILEQIPNADLKIKTADGSIFVFAMSDVARITKEESAPTAPTASQTMAPSTPFTLVVNPLGFAQFGPMVKGEVRIAPNVYLTPWVRFHALGVLSAVVAQSEGETVSIDITSLGLGFGIMRFIPTADGRRGMYVGAAAEYGWIDSLHDLDKSWEWRVANVQVAVVTNIGYRWRFQPMALLLGGIAGAAYTFSSQWWYTAASGYLGDTSIHTSEPSIFPFAMLELAAAYEL